MEYSIRQAQGIIRAYVKTGLGYVRNGGLTPYLVGDPGIGKTAIVETIAREFNMKFFALHLSYREPTDLLGLPMFDKYKDGTTITRFVPPSFMVYDKDDTVMLFLDELPQGVPTVQNGASQLIHERRIGDRVLPENTIIIAAGNKATNRANTFPLGAHLKNRIETIPVGVNHEEWIDDFANPVELHEAVVSYIRRSPDMLSKTDPNADSYPSPRSWTKVGLALKKELPTYVERAMLNGELGSAPAAMFLAHMEIYRGLRDPAEIIANPKGCKIPSGNSAAAILWSEITMLARRAGKDNVDAICTYFGRLPGEYSTIGMRDILSRRKEGVKDFGKALLVTSRSGREWLSANADLIISATE